MFKCFLQPKRVTRLPSLHHVRERERKEKRKKNQVETFILWMTRLRSTEVSSSSKVTHHLHGSTGTRTRVSQSQHCPTLPASSASSGLVRNTEEWAEPWAEEGTRSWCRLGHLLVEWSLARSFPLLGLGISSESDKTSSTSVTSGLGVYN